RIDSHEGRFHAGRAEALAEQDQLRPPLWREVRPTRAHGVEERSPRFVRQPGIHEGGKPAWEKRVLYGNEGCVATVQLLKGCGSFRYHPAGSSRHPDDQHLAIEAARTFELADCERCPACNGVGGAHSHVDPYRISEPGFDPVERL